MVANRRFSAGFCKFVCSYVRVPASKGLELSAMIEMVAYLAIVSECVDVIIV
eukprot:SAG31_NODE_4129_length_3555_cov_25.339988_4_plen_52_part_00